MDWDRYLRPFMGISSNLEVDEETVMLMSMQLADPAPNATLWSQQALIVKVSVDLMYCI